MCRWVSIIPGITMPPEPSISTVPSGTSRLGPTAAILSSWVSTSAPVSTVFASSITSTVAPRSTTGGRAPWSAISLLLDVRTGSDACPPSGQWLKPLTLWTAAEDVSTDPRPWDGGLMPRTGTGPDFIESLARGLQVIAAFEPGREALSLSDAAAATGLARPTVRRILLTLAELGYVRVDGPRYTLTPRVLELGAAYVGSLGLWDVARP